MSYWAMIDIEKQKRIDIEKHQGLKSINQSGFIDYAAQAGLLLSCPIAHCCDQVRLSEAHLLDYIWT